MRPRPTAGPPRSNAPAACGPGLRRDRRDGLADLRLAGAEVVVLSVGGYTVANNGNIRIEGNEIRQPRYAFYMKQLDVFVYLKVYHPLQQKSYEKHEFDEDGQIVRRVPCGGRR